MIGTKNLNQMATKKFLLIFFVSVVVYFVLDYVFNNAMLYIVGGIVGGSIGEALSAIGIKSGIVLVCLVWGALLTGLIILFYRLSSKVWKYILIILVAVFLYVIDMCFANIPYSDTENVVLISNIVIGFLILVKSLALSWIIYTGLVRNY